LLDDRQRLIALAEEVCVFAAFDLASGFGHSAGNERVSRTGKFPAA
jgi:hypothetical protein